MFKTKKWLLLAYCVLFSYISTGQVKHKILLDSDNSANEIRLRSAVNSASNGDIFQLQITNSVIKDEVTISSPIVITKSITIESYNSSKKVRLNGQNRSRILEVKSGAKLTLKNIELREGKGAPYQSFSNSAGGAILNEGTVSLTGCRLIKSKATIGGAIANFRGTLNFVASNYFYGNQATDGSAVFDYLGFIKVGSGGPSNASIDGTLAINIKRDRTRGVAFYTKFEGSGNFFKGGVTFMRSVQVTSNRDDGTRGTLRYAIDNALRNDIITFKGVSNITLNRPLSIKKSISIVGPVTIDGNSKYQIFNINDNSSKLLDVTLFKVGMIHGFSSTNGGAVYSKENLKLIGVNIRYCYTTMHGGGIYNDSGAVLTVLQSPGFGNTIWYNSAVIKGGGIYNAGKLWYGEDYSTIIPRTGSLPALKISTFFPIQLGVPTDFQNKPVFDPPKILHNTSFFGGGIFAEQESSVCRGINSQRQRLVASTYSGSKAFRMGDDYWLGVGGYRIGSNAYVRNNGPDDLFIRGVGNYKTKREGFFRATNNSIASAKISPRSEIEIFRNVSARRSSPGIWEKYLYKRSPQAGYFRSGKRIALTSGYSILEYDSAGNITNVLRRIEEYIPTGTWTNIENSRQTAYTEFHGCNWVRRNSKLNSGDDPCDATNKVTAVVNPPLYGDLKYISGIKVNNRSNLWFYYQQAATTNPNVYIRRYSGTQLVQLSKYAFMILQRNKTSSFYVLKGASFNWTNSIVGTYKRETSPYNTLKMEKTNGKYYISFLGKKSPALTVTNSKGLFTNPVSGSTYVFLNDKVYVRGKNKNLIAVYKK